MSTGGPAGNGGFFSQLGPSGPYGAWPGCGCSSLLIVLGGLFLVCGGGMQLFERMFR